MYTVQSNEEKQTARQIHEFCVDDLVQIRQRFSDVDGKAECGMVYLKVAIFDDYLI